jgi:DNA-binding NarL/FixJ family response regulator
MISSEPRPKIYVIADRTDSQEMIWRELCLEPLELVPLTDEQHYFEILNDIETGCTLVDVSNNPEEALKTIASIRAKQGRMQVIAFSDQWKVSTAVKAVQLGAIGVCEFPTQGDELKNTIQEALSAAKSLSSEMHAAFPESVTERLTAEESCILRLIFRGLTAKEASASLDLSVRTFHYRKQSILHKLCVKNRHELIELIKREMSQTAI